MQTSAFAHYPVAVPYSYEIVTGNRGKVKRNVKKLPLTVIGKRELRLDIHMDGQILPLVAAEVLTVGLFILQSLIESEGKLEI